MLNNNRHPFSPAVYIPAHVKVMDLSKYYVKHPSEMSRKEIEGIKECALSVII